MRRGVDGRSKPVGIHARSVRESIIKLKLKANEINRRRMLRGWLLRDLAQAANLHQNTITQIVSGNGVGVVAARKVARALKTDLVELIEVVASGATEPVAAGAA
jgi:transcriptional regulator with XRE-family HTH domain